MRWSFLFLQLVVFWAALSLELKNPMLVGFGLVTAVVVTAVLWRRRLAIADWGPKPLLLTLLLYLPWLLWQVVLANLRVLRVIWSPKPNINPQLVTVPSTLTTRTGRAVYANSITMTPGTVTIDVSHDSLQVHALTDQDAADLLDGNMQGRVARLEQLA